MDRLISMKIFGRKNNLSPGAALLSPLSLSFFHLPGTHVSSIYFLGGWTLQKSLFPPKRGIQWLIWVPDRCVPKHLDRSFISPPPCQGNAGTVRPAVSWNIWLALQHEESASQEFPSASFARTCKTDSLENLCFLPVDLGSTNGVNSRNIWHWYTMPFQSYVRQVCKLAFFKPNILEHVRRISYMVYCNFHVSYLSKQVLTQSAFQKES